ncbi:MAG: hypothetical protein WCK02_04575 [Bacteroidota bacterium]
MEYLLFFLFLVLICLGIYKLRFFKSTSLSFAVLVFVFAIKLIAGLGLNVLYSKYYTDKNTSDIYKYFDDSKYLSDVASVSSIEYFKLMYNSRSTNTLAQAQVVKMKNWSDKNSNYLKITNAPESDVFNSQRTMIRLNSLLRFLSLGFLPIHTLFFCLLGFIGQILLFKAFIGFVPNRKNQLLLVVFFIPSVVLWTSAALKESVIYFGLGLFIYYLLSSNIKQFKFYFFLAFSVLILLFLKSYLAIMLLIAAFGYYTILYFNKKQIIVLLGLLLFLVLSLVVNKPETIPLKTVAMKMQNEKNIARGGYYLNDIDCPENQIYIEENYFKSLNLLPVNKDEYIIPEGINYNKYFKGHIFDDELLKTTKKDQYYLMLNYQRAGSYLENTNLSPSIVSFIAFLPKAILNVFLEPLIYKANSVLLLFSSLENVAIFILLIFSFVFLKFDESYNAIIVFNLLFALCLLFLVAYTTPIAGNIVRYKIPAITFLMINFVLSYNETRIRGFYINIISFLNRIRR